MDDATSSGVRSQMSMPKPRLGWASDLLGWEEWGVEIVSRREREGEREGDCGGEPVGEGGADEYECR